MVQWASLSAGQHRLSAMAAQPAAQPSEAARLLLGLLGECAQQWRACIKLNWVLRPILDLHALHKYMRQYKFRTLTHTALISFVHTGD